MVICLERGADLHIAQLMPLPLTVSCFSKIQIGLSFLVPAHLGSPGKGPLNVCVCVCVDADKLDILVDTLCSMLNNLFGRQNTFYHLAEYSACLPLSFCLYWLVP